MVTFVGSMISCISFDSHMNFFQMAIKRSFFTKLFTTLMALMFFQSSMDNIDMEFEFAFSKEGLFTKFTLKILFLCDVFMFIFDVFILSAPGEARALVHLAFS